MSTIEILHVIEDERRREARRAELSRLARDGRVHRRPLSERIGRLIQRSVR
jgi:hypothetical protein